MRERAGRVFLVGAGPGAPDLLTLRGAELLRRADVVLFDSLIDPVLLDLLPEHAERIDVGKRGHDEPVRSQRDIETLMVEHARRGRRVVRLKGGDPFVFGRGAEEAGACAAAGIPCEVVPGVSSAFAGPALAGIPLTDRRHAASFAVVTGHKDPTRVREEIRWEGLAEAADTLVVLMGMRNLPELVEKMIAGGRAATTPAAAVMDASSNAQRVVEAPLAELPERVREAGLGAPSVIVVGDVVRLRSELPALDRMPLFGWRVLVTRPEPAASDWVAGLREAGAQVRSLPMIEIVPIVGTPEQAEAFEAWDRYDAVLFTSANAVRQLAQRAREQGLDPAQLAVTAHCVGPATARAALAEGFAIGDLPLRGFDARALADRLLSEGDLGGRRYLLPQALRGRGVLAEALRSAGARVDVVPVYRTDPAPFDPAPLRAALRERELDALLFASPSAVRAFAGALEEDREAARAARIVALGPATAEALQEAGLPPDLQPESATLEACIEALAASRPPHDEGDAA